MEPITLLLDAFIKLADRIINIEKLKREDKKQVFKEIIEPLFLQLQPVAESYTSLFRTAKQSIVESPESELWATIKKIRELREQTNLARITVRSMAHQVAALYKDEKISNFTDEINMFFYASIIPLPDKKALSRSEELIEMLERSIISGDGKTAMINHINDTLRGHEWTWAEVGKSYTAIKIDYLSAPSLIQK